MPCVETMHVVQSPVDVQLVLQLLRYSRAWEKGAMVESERLRVRTAHPSGRHEKRANRHKYAAALLLCLLGIGGCAADEPLDMSSYDPSHDQMAIAGYYRDQAVSMREKANAQATAATRYEALFARGIDVDPRRRKFC